MPSDFDRMVLEFMSESGFTATYVKQVSSIPNYADGSVAVITENIPVSAIRMDLIRPMEGSGTKSGTLIKDGDQILYVRPTEKADVMAEALVIDPSSDKVIINNVAWSVVTVKEYNPSASDCILYELYIRK